MSSTRVCSASMMQSTYVELSSNPGQILQLYFSVYRHNNRLEIILRGGRGVGADSSSVTVRLFNTLAQIKISLQVLDGLKSNLAET